MSDQPTRILRIITGLQISGPALQALLLTAQMQQQGYQSWLVSGSHQPGDSLTQLAQEYDVPLITAPAMRFSMNPLHYINTVRQLYRIMQQMQPDIVHTHTTTAGFVGRLTARLAGVPVVVHTLHEHPFQGYYNRAQTLAFVMLERIGAYLSDSIITLSESLRKELSDRYHITHKKRITVLPLGFDLTVFSQTKRHQGNFRAAWSIPEEALLVGIVGRLLPVKNHTLFLQAAARIREQLPAVCFVIVGDGEQRAYLESLTPQLGLSDTVIFTGWQQHMEHIYSDLDVLAISSWNEGMPVPLIEALAAGCPVVATDVGGISDLLDAGRLGQLVPSGDVQAFADALMQTLNNPPDPKTGRETMLHRYSIENLAQDLDSLYQGLFAQKARCRATNLTRE